MYSVCLCIFEDSLAFFHPWGNINKSGKQRSIWQIVFNCLYSIMSTPDKRYFIKSQILRKDKVELDMVLVLKELIFYLEGQDAFINIYP